VAPVQNVTIFVVEEQSGLARNAGPTVLVTSHLQLRSRDAPNTQLITVHFDDANKMSTLDLSQDMRRVLMGFSGVVTAYAVNISMPWYAWSGQVRTCAAIWQHVRDGRGCKDGSFWWLWWW
jgi:hypothetical protein